MKRKQFIFSFILLLMNLFYATAQDKLYSNTFSLRDVELLDGPFRHACNLNVQILLKYDTDRLLAPFLKEAGLPPKGESFPNWIGLDGHIGGHYLSALAIHYVATGNLECKKRMEYIISELKRCQEANGDGYVGGVPNGKFLWEEIKKGNTAIVWKSWVPWYNLHKIYAGIRDAWLYGGNEEAKQMFLKLCDWGINVISSLNEQQMEDMLANEFGGMNEIYADAYQLTQDIKYLNAAKRFSHRWLLNSMADRKDNLDNKHANTQVPKAVGYQRIAELTHDTTYTTAAEFFWNRVVNNHSLSLGGNSRREHFPEKDDCISYAEEREGPETCNTYNMLKLTEGLFRMHPSAHYADFYERAMFNHILSSQHPEHGGYVYFTPARPCHYRVYSAPNCAMWCCVGTGMENHGKYGEFIYSHTVDSLFVNLFVASKLNWKSKGVTLIQNTRFPDEESSKITIKVKKPIRFTLLVRHPQWVSAGNMKVTCNGKNYANSSSPSSYIKINKVWKNGDIVEIKTPMRISIEEMPNVPNYISILRGPIVLGAKTGKENMKGLIADDSRMGHIASGSLVPSFEAPLIIGTKVEIKEKLKNIQPITGKSFSYTISGIVQQDKYKDLILEPFFRIHDSRYIIYWQSMPQKEFEHYLAIKQKEELLKIQIDQRTIDVVIAGEQQPEADHFMKNENSRTGNLERESWRDARNKGYFQYKLKTEGNENLSLMVRYWGRETGYRTFDILIDGVKFLTENVSKKWNKGSFINVEYPIPAEMLKNKQYINITFQSRENSIAGRVAAVRLLHTK